ncbi:Dbl homology domain-containing protein [Mycena galericulata]|nr:Dbl homology domain-containing protein [Mycena galericulata]
MDTVVIPPNAFESTPAVNPSESGRVLSTPRDPTSAHASKAQETARKNCINEIVETERKYVKDLEAMLKYVGILSESKRIDEDTRRRLFANIDEIFHFQCKFLIRLERTAVLEWQDQRWGQDFLEAEKEFSEVYAPYCANYNKASELVVTPDLQHKLASLNHVIDVKGELPGFIKKPVGRVCKYPLLVEFLIKASSADNYQHYEELKNGLQAAKRVADKINEAHRKAENEETVKSLRTRVDDWVGLNLDDFGELLLDDTFVVTRSDVDREYHVFLFEKLMLLCKEVHPNENVRTRDSRTMPLLIKGRISVSDITQATPSVELDALASSFPRKYTLAVWWKGDDSLQSFTLRSRTEYQMKLWQSQINKLIEESAQHGGSPTFQPRDGSGFQDTSEDPLVTPSDGEQPSEIRPLSGRGTIPSNAQPLESETIDQNPPTPVRVKVHFNEDIFILRVPLATEYNALLEKIEHKLCLCGPRSDEGPLQLMHKQEDGDLVLLSSSEEVRTALEECQVSGEQLTLYV